MRKTWLGAALLVVGLAAAVIWWPDEPDVAPRLEVASALTPLSLDITLDKDVYHEAEPIQATLELTNDGPAVHARVDCAAATNYLSTNLAGHDDQIRLDTGQLRAPIPLARGGSVTGIATGVISAAAYNVGVVSVVCTATASSTSAIVLTSEVRAPVVGAGHAVTGRFTVCRNDGSDVGAAGVALTLVRGVDHSPTSSPGPWSTVTDADGRFAFPVVAAGPYVLEYKPPAGYVRNTIPNQDTIEVLVAGDGVRWQASDLTVTTADPATSCS